MLSPHMSDMVVKLVFVSTFTIVILQCDNLSQERIKLNDKSTKNRVVLLKGQAPQKVLLFLVIHCTSNSNRQLEKLLNAQVPSEHFYCLAFHSSLNNYAKEFLTLFVNLFHLPMALKLLVISSWTRKSPFSSEMKHS